jgi:hypothetical protein
MSMRRWAAVVLVVGVVVATPIVVRAATGTGAGALDRQSFAWRDTAISTTNQTFSDVAAMTVTVCAAGPLTVEISAGVNGAAMGMRVVIDHAATAMHPGEAHFDDAGGTTSFGFGFADTVAPVGGKDLHSISMQWRAPTGVSTTLVRALLNVLYQQGSVCA